jgi:hypothetical protein
MITMEMPINPWQALQRSVAKKLGSESLENPQAKRGPANAYAAAPASNWLVRARKATALHHQPVR